MLKQVETEEEFLHRIRGGVTSIDLAFLDTLSSGDFNRLCVIKKHHWKDLQFTGDYACDLEILKSFCTPKWSERATKARNPDWQAVVDFLVLEAFKRRIGATNESSAGFYPDDTGSKYACEYWRINACILICEIPLGTPVTSHNIPQGTGMKPGGKVYLSIVNFISGESHAATSYNSVQAMASGGGKHELSRDVELYFFAGSPKKLKLSDSVLPGTVSSLIVDEPSISIAVSTEILVSPGEPSKELLAKGKAKGYEEKQIVEMFSSNVDCWKKKNLPGPFKCHYNSGHLLDNPKDFYFKKNGDPSTLCLIHELLLHSAANKKKYSEKKVEEDRQKVKAGLEPSYKKKNDKWNPLINGTDQAHAYQRAYRLKIKNAIPESTPVVETLMKKAKSFAKILNHLKHVLQSGKIIVWDTEYDEYRNRCELEHIREWRFKKLDTQEVLSIRRYSGDNHWNPREERAKNPYYSDDKAKQDILAFIPGYTLIAKEKQSVDRLRLKSLVGEIEYGRVLPQLMDFERQFLAPITSKNIKDTSKIYLTSQSADTLFPCLFMDDDDLKAQFVDMLQDTSGYEKKDKCVQDVLELENLIILWLCILFKK